MSDERLFVYLLVAKLLRKRLLGPQELLLKYDFITLGDNISMAEPRSTTVHETGAAERSVS